MKILKFGTVSVNEKEELQLHGFSFGTEDGDPENYRMRVIVCLGAVIDFLQSKQAKEIEELGGKDQG